MSCLVIAEFLTEPFVNSIFFETFSDCLEALKSHIKTTMKPSELSLIGECDNNNNNNNNFFVSYFCFIESSERPGQLYRDLHSIVCNLERLGAIELISPDLCADNRPSVSYTHLTLPTIYSV